MVDCACGLFSILLRSQASALEHGNVVSSTPRGSFQDPTICHTNTSRRPDCQTIPRRNFQHVPQNKSVPDTCALESRVHDMMQAPGVRKYKLRNVHRCHHAFQYCRYLEHPWCLIELSYYSTRQLWLISRKDVPHLEPVRVEPKISLSHGTKFRLIA